jgi:hypothetical protein
MYVENRGDHQGQGESCRKPISYVSVVMPQPLPSTSRRVLAWLVLTAGCVFCLIAVCLFATWWAWPARYWYFGVCHIILCFVCILLAYLLINAALDVLDPTPSKYITGASCFQRGQWYPSIMDTDKILKYLGTVLLSAAGSALYSLVSVMLGGAAGILAHVEGLTLVTDIIIGAVVFFIFAMGLNVFAFWRQNRALPGTDSRLSQIGENASRHIQALEKNSATAQ